MAFFDDYSRKEKTSLTKLWGLKNPLTQALLLVLVFGVLPLGAVLLRLV